MSKDINIKDAKAILNALTKPILLVGMMGTGKSHMGKLLAETLGLEFHDSDKVIETRGGLSINEIFELYGEERFRESETKTILELMDAGPSVIATGGGALTNNAVLEAMNEKSHSIWLTTDIDILMKRLEQSKERPLLREDNPREIVSTLMEKRQALYARADIEIDTGAGNADKTIKNMINELQAILPK